MRWAVLEFGSAEMVAICYPLIVNKNTFHNKCMPACPSRNQSAMYYYVLTTCVFCGKGNTTTDVLDVHVTLEHFPFHFAQNVASTTCCYDQLAQNFCWLFINRKFFINNNILKYIIFLVIMEFATMVQELTMFNDYWLWDKILRQKAR
jgi:hypothetical protein